jgi:hypothetical protein
MRRWEFSVQKPHPEQRPIVDFAKRREFFETMTAIPRTTPSWRVLSDIGCENRIEIDTPAIEDPEKVHDDYCRFPQIY